MNCIDISPEALQKCSDDLEKSVFIENGHIVINVDYEYNIELSRCNTHKKLLGWTLHLAQKKWMSSTMLYRFVKLACLEHGLEIPHP